MMNNNLTNAEMLVMGIIWDNPKRDMVLSEIVAAVNDRWKKDWKPQTVSTYLAHLVQKGYLKMHRNGKIYTYEALREKDETMTEELVKLCQWYAPELNPVEIIKGLFPEDWQREIGTVDECRVAVELNKPKRPTYEGDGYAPDGSFVWDEWLCPNCGSRYELDYDEYEHCPNCGQAIDWN